MGITVPLPLPNLHLEESDRHKGMWPPYMAFILSYSTKGSIGGYQNSHFSHGTKSHLSVDNCVADISPL